MTAPGGGYREAMAERHVEVRRLAHLSIAVGRLGGDGPAVEPDRLDRYFTRIAPWVEAARRSCAQGVPDGRARISTCLLVDDYRTSCDPPARVITAVRDAARRSRIAVDYVARGSGCVEAEDVPVARLVEDRLVAEPPPGTTGIRPPLTKTGWLSNGERTIEGPEEAMSAARAWTTPRLNRPGTDPVLIDVQLWNDTDAGRVWSGPFVTAVWYLLRLDLLRYFGQPIVSPVRVADDDLPDEWEALPPVVALTDHPAPFAGYRALSILPAELLPAEHAARTILGQLELDPALTGELRRYADRDGVSLPLDPVERVDRLFVPDLP